jgi:putative SOS response-associated peptidase YedK
MCGRFASTSSVADIAESFGVDEERVEAVPPRYNVAPTQQVYAIATIRAPRPAAPSDAPAGFGEAAGPGARGAAGGEDGGSRRVLDTFRWGLVPSWAKDLSVGHKMINARGEGLGERPAYRRALIKRRCVIPVDSYYEWQPRPGTKVKLPWAIHRRDGAPMAVAGLWEEWWDPAGDPGAEPLRSCTIVTTSANSALAAIHDRMPVVFDATAMERWLDPELVDREELEALLRPAPPEWFDAYPVSTLVNKVSVDGPELLGAIPPPSGVELGVPLFHPGGPLSGSVPAEPPRSGPRRR